MSNLQVFNLGTINIVDKMVLEGLFFNHFLKWSLFKPFKNHKSLPPARKLPRSKLKLPSTILFIILILSRI